MIKRIISILLILVLVMCLCSCTKKSSTDSLTSTSAIITSDSTAPLSGNINLSPLMLQVADNAIYDYESRNRHYSIHWSSLRLNNESANKFPALADKLNQINEACTSQAEAVAAPIINHFKSSHKDNFTYSYNSEISIMRADNLILSFCNHISTIQNNDVISSDILGVNMDPVTGEYLSLESVILDIQKLITVLGKEIIENNPDLNTENLNNNLDNISSEDMSWTLGCQGITFYFSPDDIPSVSLGKLQVNIWFNEYPELFEKAYLGIPSYGFAQAIKLKERVEFDKNPVDNNTDWIYLNTIFQDADENWEYLSVIMNGKKTTIISELAYNYDSYLVRMSTPDGERFYLCVEASTEYDHNTFHIIDLNDDVPHEMEPLYNLGFHEVWADGDIYSDAYTDIFTDPFNFVLDTEFDMLGTMRGARNYSMDPYTGELLPKTNYYNAPEGYPTITSKIPLKVIILPQEKLELLPAGTVFRFLRTDAVSYVDMMLADGRECRIIVEREDYEFMVNGISERECFEELYYYG